MIRTFFGNKSVKEVYACYECRSRSGIDMLQVTPVTSIQSYIFYALYSYSYSCCY